MLRGDTIAAISSSVGPAARIIVRVSGPASCQIAEMLGMPVDLPRASVSRQELHFADFIVPAWVYRFQSPRSYTGEDLVELHIPGSPLLASRLLDHLLKRGIRSAEPGEFTARAFFNGRMDLSSAEGVSAVIAAGNEQELQAGRQLMAGELARRLKPIMDSLQKTLALVEVGIDFSQEDVTILEAQEQTSRIEQIDAALRRLLDESSRFARLSHEPRLVLVGRPNAGKSTLLNALAGHDRAVVSPIAGTTRDVLSARIVLPGGCVQITDIAGIEAVNTTDPIEQQMRSQAERAIAEADLIALVKDATDSAPAIELQRAPSVVIRTKLDLIQPSARPYPEASDGAESVEFAVSARTGAGLHQLIAALDALCFGSKATNNRLALNVRHVQAIGLARHALARTAKVTDSELIAADLREALEALGSILGQVSADDVLGLIFSGFCIGK